MTSKTTQFCQGFPELKSILPDENKIIQHFTHDISPQAKDLLLAADI